MSGWIIDRHGKSFDDAIDTLQYREIPGSSSAPLSSTEVRVRVHAAALNYFDLLAMVNRYQVKYELPFTPCSEAAGVVVEAGKDASFNVGDEVIYFFGAGAAREYVVCESRMLCKKPSRLSFAEASAIMVGWATGYHGLAQRGQLKRGEVVLVTGGSGGMGSIAISMAKEMGATVVATVSTEAKKRTCEAAGADHVVVLANNPNNDPKVWAKQLKAALPGGEADVCYEVCGGALFLACARVMRSQGRLLVVGFASGTIAKLPSNLPLIKGYSVVGVRSGAELLIRPELMTETVDALEKSQLRPHVELFSARDGKAAFRKLAAKQAQGKLVLNFSGSSSKL